LNGRAATRLVLDQGVPRDAAARLRALGYECMHAGEIGMGKSGDDEILAWSLGKNAIIVTLDADFHTILAVSGASGPSVIRVRMQGLGARAVAELVHDVLVGFGDDLKRGSLVTVKARKITCHRLPIGRSD
jgi:predicted nuclease of predicted toxin-antitoxin system